MKPPILLIVLVILVLNACTHNTEEPSTPVDTPVKTSLRTIVTTSASGTDSLLLSHYHNTDMIDNLSSTHFTYDTVRQLLISIGRYINLFAQTIRYDVNGLPIGGRINNDYYGGTGGSYQYDSDSVIYRLQGTRITEMILCNHKHTPSGPFPPTLSTDTSLRITISYTNDNPQNIHAAYANGASYDLAYTYGTHKSPLYRSRIKFMVSPNDTYNLFLLSGHYIDFFAANDVLSIKRTGVTANGVSSFEKIDFLYTYNSAGYPLTAQATFGTGKTLSQQFLYE